MAKTIKTRTDGTISAGLLAQSRGRPPKPPTPWAKTDPQIRERYKTARAKFRSLHPTDAAKRKYRRILQLRKVMRLSQSQFARQIGVSIRTLSRWENGGGHLPIRRSWKRIVELEKLNQEILADTRKEGYEPDFGER